MKKTARIVVGVVAAVGYVYLTWFVGTHWMGPVIDGPRVQSTLK